MAALAAYSTVFLGFGLGLDGFLSYAQTSGEAAAAQVMELSHRQNEGRGTAGLTPASPILVSGASFVGFFFFTPLGLLSSYFFVSGVVRGVMSAAGSPGGDPILSMADAVLDPWLKRRAIERAATERAAQEGPEVPDVVVKGPEARIPEASFVVIASRLKPGWETGVFVVAADTWWRIGARQDRRTIEGLRALYPLTPVGAAEVIRRAVHYDDPALSRPPGATVSPAVPTGAASERRRR